MRSEAITTIAKPGVGAVTVQPGQDGQEGKIGWALAWLIGVPLPVLVILYLIFGR